MKGKRGQVTIFIVLAIVLVLGIIVYFILSTPSNQSEIFGSNTDNIEKISSQVSGVYTQVDNYLVNTIEEGLEILRLQGGYIYIPSGTRTVSVETAGKHVILRDGVPEIVERSGRTNIPLWVGKTSLAVPSKRFMEEQLEKYVENKLLELNLDEFRDQGIGLDLGEIFVNASFDYNVFVTVNYPIEATRNGNSYIFEEYSYLFGINFDEIYDMASGLAIYELGYQYLEGHAKSLMSLYAYSGNYKRPYSLPPHSFTETNTNCNFVTWNPLEVKRSLMGIFEKNYDFLKIGGTDFEKVVVSDKSSQGTYDSFIYNLYEDRENMKVDIYYDSYNDLHVRTNPDVLIPDRVTQNKIPFLPMFCAFKYKFSYTLDAPIIFKISDKDSTGFSAEGYEFYFPIQMYICNDKARSCNEILEFELNEELAEETLGINLYNCQDVDSEYVITVTGEDGALSDVDIIHSCEGYDNDCWLGRTGDGDVTVNLPKCANSTISVTKDGYQSVSDVVKSSYYLDKLKEYELDVKLIRVEDFAEAYHLTDGFTHEPCSKSIQFYENEYTHDPSEKDDIIFSITGDNLFFFTWPLDDKVELGSGNYEIQSVVNSKVKIFPSYVGNLPVSFNVNDPEVPYEGDWLMGATSHSIRIDPSETIGASKVTFYALVERVSTEELEVDNFINNLIEDSGIVGDLSLDANCDGNEEIVSVNIPKSEYTKFIKPRFS
jgi:hypothetical protein